MPMPRVRFTVRRMMVAVSSAALIFGALRTDKPGLAGILIVAGCIAGLAHKLSSETLARMRTKGVPVGPTRKLDVILGATGRAAAIVLASDFAFLVVYFSYLTLVTFGRHHFYLHLKTEHIVIGTVLGAMAAISVASRMRQIIREKEGVLDNVQPSTCVPETSPGALETVTPEV